MMLRLGCLANPFAKTFGASAEQVIQPERRANHSLQREGKSVDTDSTSATALEPPLRHAVQTPVGPQGRPQQPHEKGVHTHGYAAEWTVSVPARFEPRHSGQLQASLRNAPDYELRRRRPGACPIVFRPERSQQRCFSRQGGPLIGAFLQFNPLYRSH
jgi:hypothetical protein